MSDDTDPNIEPEKILTPKALTPKALTPEARRALAEAQARREAQIAQDLAFEEGGPSGLEPTRYGDWERKGMAVDF